MIFLGMYLGEVRTTHATPATCDVTVDQDLDKSSNWPPPGSFRMALIHALGNECVDKKITFKVSKITMNAPLLGDGLKSLKGYTLEPDPTIPSVEIRVSYDNPDIEFTWSAPPPFENCFIYLPTSNVTIRNIKVTVDTSSKTAPLRGLCIDRDEDIASNPGYSNILLKQNEFNGFKKGGIFASESTYGILMSQNTFHDSGPGIIIEPNLETVQAPVMGGSNQALFAVVDTQGAVVEYHLRGLFQDTDTFAPVIELYESDGKAGTTYIKDCTFTKKMIDGKWNIDCVLPKTIALPFNYAVTLTRNMGTDPASVDSMTSMFAVGTIPADLAKEPVIVPSTPQSPVVPPQDPITDKNPPKTQDNVHNTADQNTPPPLSLSAGSPAGAGCSLIR